VLTRGWASRDAWRGTRLGLWAWLLQRAAAVALVVVIGLHLRNPFLRPVQATLLALVLLHGLLGLRAILLDLGLPVRLHRALFAAALILGVALFALVWWWRWY
jgi:succinate dehydrogenase hydrophobic anchor subunit